MVAKKKKPPAVRPKSRAPSFRRVDSAGRFHDLATGHFAAPPRKGARYVGADGRWRGPYPKKTLAKAPKAAPKPRRPPTPRGAVKKRHGPKPAPLPPARKVPKREFDVFKAKVDTPRKTKKIRRALAAPRPEPVPLRDMPAMPLRAEEWVNKWRPYLKTIQARLASELGTASQVSEAEEYSGDEAEIDLVIQVPGGAESLIGRDPLYFDGWLTSVEEVVWSVIPRGAGWAHLDIGFEPISDEAAESALEEEPTIGEKYEAWERGYRVMTFAHDTRGSVAKIWDAARAIVEASVGAQMDRVGFQSHAVARVTLRLTYGPKPVW